jgi:hypothetical protein
VHLSWTHASRNSRALVTLSYSHLPTSKYHFIVRMSHAQCSPACVFILYHVCCSIVASHYLISGLSIDAPACSYPRFMSSNSSRLHEQQAAPSHTAHPAHPRSGFAGARPVVRPALAPLPCHSRHRHRHRHRSLLNAEAACPARRLGGQARRAAEARCHACGSARSASRMDSVRWTHPDSRARGTKMTRKLQLAGRYPGPVRS